jgi:hypothetical protein
MITEFGLIKHHQEHTDNFAIKKIKKKVGEVGEVGEVEKTR